MDMGKSDIYNSIDKKKDTSKGANQINQLNYITKEEKNVIHTRNYRSG